MSCNTRLAVLAILREMVVTNTEPFTARELKHQLNDSFGKSNHRNGKILPIRLQEVTDETPVKEG